MTLDPTDNDLDPSSRDSVCVNNSKVAVLLVSPDYSASDFIHEHELGPLLKEAEQRRVKILWIPIRATSTGPRFLPVPNKGHRDSARLKQNHGYPGCRSRKIFQNSHAENVSSAPFCSFEFERRMHVAPALVLPAACWSCFLPYPFYIWGRR
jgi:hypothetical protein